eukprot:COSAG01_NODE_2460_length_7655_cov_15.411858_3_plen_610_part_00
MDPGPWYYVSITPSRRRPPAPVTCGQQDGATSEQRAVSPRAAVPLAGGGALLLPMHWPVVAISVLSQVLLPEATTTTTKIIKLNASNVIDGFCAPQGGGQESNVPYNLLDEQGLAGDPLSGTGGVPKTNWNPGFVKWYYPEIFTVIDLGSPHIVRHVCGFHEYGGVDLEISFAQHITKPSFSLPVYTAAGGPDRHHPTKYWEKSWACFNMTVTARFVSIRLNSPTNIYELVIYGDNAHHTGKHVKVQPRTPRRAPLMKYFLGVNGFVDDPVERLSACAGAVREYQDWVWTEGQGDPGFPNARNKFEPSYSSFEIDRFYQAAANASLDVHQVIQNRPWFLSNGNKTEEEWKPIEDELIHNLTAIVDPHSYGGIAGHAFQVAARYGAKSVPPQLLQIAEGQPRLSGLAVLKHIEILNEPNGWWRGREGFMKPFEIAAMLSAVYDAHEGSLSDFRAGGIGIKTVDSSMQVVMPGVTGTSRRNLDIVRMIRLWAQSERKDGKFPADVLNFHGYSTDLQANPGDQGPEGANMTAGLRELVAWRDTYEPNMEVWLTEFGYDTSQGSPNRAKQYASYSAEEVQGMWLVRGFMLGVAAGLDVSTVFRFQTSRFKVKS